MSRIGIMALAAAMAARPDLFEGPGIEITRAREPEPDIDLTRTLPAKAPATPRPLDARDHERLAAAAAKRARKAARRK